MQYPLNGANKVPFLQVVHSLLLGPEHAPQLASQKSQVTI